MPSDQEKIAKGERDDMDSAKQDADARVADTQALLASLQEAERQRADFDGSRFGQCPRRHSRRLVAEIVGGDASRR